MLTMSGPEGPDRRKGLSDVPRAARDAGRSFPGRSLGRITRRRAGSPSRPDGKRLYVALDDMDEVVEVDAGTRRVVRKVEGAPAARPVSRSTRRASASTSPAEPATVSPSSTPATLTEVAVGAGRYRLRSGSRSSRRTGSGRLVVANSVSDDVTVLSTSPLASLGHLTGGREPYAVAACARREQGPGREPDGRHHAAATRSRRPRSRSSIRRRSASSRETGSSRLTCRKESARCRGGRGPCRRSSRSGTWSRSPRRPRGGSCRPASRVCDLSKGSVVELPLDEANAYFADPSGIAVEPSGKRAFIASGGARRRDGGRPRAALALAGDRGRGTRGATRSTTCSFRRSTSWPASRRAGTRARSR